MTTLQEVIDGMSEQGADMWQEIGPKFTCQEANALVALLRVLGLPGHADWLERSHADGDYEEDQHWNGTRREGD